jgi:hypothetical protein
MIDWDAMCTGPCVAVFGEDIDYTPTGGGTVTVQLVYDEGNKDVIIAGDVGMNNSNPIVSGSLSVFLPFGFEPQQGDTLVIRRTGDAFTVKDVNEDGKGSVTLPLNYLGDT